MRAVTVQICHDFDRLFFNRNIYECPVSYPRDCTTKMLANAIERSESVGGDCTTDLVTIRHDHTLDLVAIRRDRT